MGDSAVNRSMDILRTIAASDRPLVVSDICATLGLPKPTAHRLCQKLESELYLTREPGGRHFTPGPKLVRLGFDLMRWGVTSERQAILEAAVGRLGETCNFTTISGNKIVYLHRVEAGWPLRVHLEPGSRVPLHCTASGKLLLAVMEPARRHRMLELIELTPDTPNSITDARRLERELEATARRGYSLDREEFMVGLSAIAVPVRDRRNAVQAALACHGPTSRFSLDDASKHLDVLIDAAGKLGRTLPE